MKFVVEKIDKQLNSNNRFFLRPSLILDLNRIAVDGLSDLPGSYRPGRMEISHSAHKPPSFAAVPGLIEEMCDYVNQNWDKDAFHLAAYLMWRLNWIHPFEDGNGRTSRAISYLVLCIKLGIRLPGEKTIPEMISDNMNPYYAALEKADSAAKRDTLEVSAMEIILKDALAKQLAEFANTLTGGHLTANAGQDRRENHQPDRRRTSKLHAHYNKYPFWYWTAAAVLAVAIALL